MDSSALHDALHKIRHSLAHILAQAVQEIRPGSKLGFGPPIEDGFYYDFILPSPISDEDIPEIEKRMKRIISENSRFIHEELSFDDALKRIDEMGEPYKREYAEELMRKKGLSSLSFYRSGSFVDMCDGPHVESSAQIPADAFKIRSIAGAYWRGNERNPMMTRIYAWAYGSKAELEAHELRYQEALKRDHKKLGKELEIFAIDDEVGKGLPLWLPNGTVIRDELEKLMRELEFKAGYQRVSSPHLAKADLYRRTGHLPYYAEGMYPPLEIKDQKGEVVESYYLRPMNCPHHHKIFSHKPRSYRDLPLRLAEYGQAYRLEDSGALSGLLRVRGFCQNDAHIYCSEDQARAELRSVLRLYDEAYAVIGLKEYRYRLSLWDPNDPKRAEKYVHDPEGWEKYEDLLRSILIEEGVEFVEAAGEAAFYGPKIDVQVRSVLGREETMSTIQLDFVMGERLNLAYIGPDGQSHRPLIIHRAPFGSHERMVAFLIEQFGGAFPAWLSPVQVKVVPIAAPHVDAARQLVDQLRARFIRAELDDSQETLQKKIRSASLQRIPHIAVIGEREREQKNVSHRRRGSPAQKVVPVMEFIEQIANEVSERRLS